MVQTLKSEYDVLVQHPSFTTWQEEHPDAYLASAYMSIGTSPQPWSIDFYCPHEQVMYSFIITDTDIDCKKNDIVYKEEKKQPEMLNPASFEADLETVIYSLKEQHAAGKTISRVMVALQCLNEKSIYQLTLFTDPLLIIHAKADAKTGEILSAKTHHLMQFADMQQGTGA